MILHKSIRLCSLPLKDILRFVSWSFHQQPHSSLPFFEHMMWSFLLITRCEIEIKLRNHKTFLRILSRPQGIFMPLSLAILPLKKVKNNSGPPNQMCRDTSAPMTTFESWPTTSWHFRYQRRVNTFLRHWFLSPLVLLHSSISKHGRRTKQKSGHRSLQTGET